MPSVGRHLPAEPDRWVLRAARDEDLEHVRQFVLACSLPAEGIGDQFGDNYAIAEADSELLGIAGVEVYRPHGLLRSVAVAASERRKGMAAWLVADRIAWATHRGLEDLYLLTTTAERYFERHGFVAIARTAVPDGIRESKEFAVACPESAVVMRRAL